MNAKKKAQSAKKKKPVECRIEHILEKEGLKYKKHRHRGERSFENTIAVATVSSQYQE